MEHEPSNQSAFSNQPDSPTGPLHPSSLPPELAEFLQGRDFACITEATDQGTVLVLKAPSRDIDSARGPVPIELRHELYDFPTAPVIRMLTTIYDRPEQPLAFETFVNVEDDQQRSEYEALSQQEQLLLLFFDEDHQHRLTKRVGRLDRERIIEVLRQADALYQAISEAQYDFDAAKAWVMGRTRL